MARIRTIKPEFWKSEAIARHTFFDRLVFIGLWTYVDDNGVGLDNPKLITAELFALEEDYAQVSRDLRESLASLAEAGRIRRYTVEGKAYLSIVHWSEHQKIDRPGKARYPQADHPGAKATTSANANPEATSHSTDAPHSRESRESLATPHLPEQGAGSMEQGAGSRDLHAAPTSQRPTNDQPSLPIQSPTPAPTAQDVVAAYVDGAVAAGKDKPTGSLIGRVGRQAKKLLDEGIPADKLVLAADQMGRAGWNDLAVQLQRPTQQAPARYQAYREATAPDGSRDMSKYRKPL